MLRKELILGILCIFLFKIFPSKQELIKININEETLQEFNENNIFNFIDELAGMKGYQNFIKLYINEKSIF